MFYDMVQKKSVKKSKVTKNQKNNSSNTIYLLTHLLGLLTGFLGPLILLLSVEEEEVKKHARNALNWQLSLLVYALITILLIFVVIGIFLIPVLIILDLTFSIIAMLKANKGELWEYPLSIPFVKNN